MRGKMIGYWVTTVIGHLVWPLGLAALAIASWALRPESRLIGTVLPKRAPLARFALAWTPWALRPDSRTLSG